MDLRSVIAHELGHKLGLEHNYKEFDGMAPTRDAGVRQMAGSFGQTLAFLSPSLVSPVSLQLNVTIPNAHGIVQLPNENFEESQAHDQLFASLDDGLAKLLVRSQITSSKSQSNASKKSAVSEDLLDEDLLEVISLAPFGYASIR